MYVGMNRDINYFTGKSGRVPHVRGDEPRTYEVAALDTAFPMYVGMNRSGCSPGPSQIRVPHVRGDEPTREKRSSETLRRSPCTWG